MDAAASAHPERSDASPDHRRALAPLPADCAPPQGFVRVTVDRTEVLDVEPDDVWAWLQDPATFTDSQVPPWKVEFIDPETGSRGAGFTQGVLTTHHGPLLHLPGVLGVQDAEDRRRELRYCYGAYVASLRLVRPVDLVFEVRPAGPGRTALRLLTRSDVRRPLRGVFKLGSRLFWGRFFSWCERSASR